LFFRIAPEKFDVILLLDIFLISQMLDVLGFLMLSSLGNRRFREMLAASQLAHCSGFIEFSLKTL
jgi:hypothetical protein